MLLVCSILACDLPPAVPPAKTTTKGTASTTAVASGREKTPAKAADDAAWDTARAGTPAPPPLFNAPAFQLTDETGAAFGSDDLRDNVWIAKDRKSVV